MSLLEHSAHNSTCYPRFAIDTNLLYAIYLLGSGVIFLPVGCTHVGGEAAWCGARRQTTARLRRVGCTQRKGTPPASGGRLGRGPP